MAARLAIAFGLSALAAIFVGASMTDNGFIQILLTAFAAIAMWIPFFVLISGIERLFTRRAAPPPSASSVFTERGWSRLGAIAPGQSERLGVLQRSLERSRLSLGKADLDPDAHDLCVLIDRRLPELIDRELDDLPPDDLNRRERIDQLLGLIEQFARHCSRRSAGETGLARFDAEVLRRRFEERLSTSV